MGRNNTQNITETQNTQNIKQNTQKEKANIKLVIIKQKQLIRTLQRAKDIKETADNNNNNNEQQQQQQQHVGGLCLWITYILLCGHVGVNNWLQAQCTDWIILNDACMILKTNHAFICQ